MHRSNFCLRAIFAVALAVAGAGASHSLAVERPASRSFASTTLISDEKPLGGPIAPLGSLAPRVNSNAAVNPSASGANPNSENSGTTTQPSVALGPAPYELGQIRRIQVGEQGMEQAPLRVGNVDILAPLAEHLPLLGASLTRADPDNVPGGLSMPTQAQHFQINLPKGPPIVLTIGKRSAWIDNHEQPLRAEPAVIGNQIYLPVFSIAPLMGAAARLNDEGTLILTPTIQSVELFRVKDTVAVTIKTSAPVPDGVARIVAVKATSGSSPKVYIDFPG